MKKKINNSVLITGVAGFIGFSLALKFLEKGEKVIGIDNINDYYSVKLKKDRIKILNNFNNFSFHKIDVSDQSKLFKLRMKYKINYIYHLAAQAGVRYSILNPSIYFSSNLKGFFNILELAKKIRVRHLIFASTSSVYGLNTKLPFTEKDPVNHPSQFYAATKRSNEIMAHSYSCIYKMNTTGVRFFTIYGPWGRPDMALFKFVKNIINKKPIELFNKGNHTRDFTYIDDAVECLIKLKKKKPAHKKKFSSHDPSSSSSPFQILNIGNQKKVSLLDFVKEIERNLKLTAKKKYLPLQQGDIELSFSKVINTKKLINYKFKVNYKLGIKRFIDWYKNYYKIN